jgi:hypothetical protein
MTAEPTIVIHLDGDGRPCGPEETLSGRYWCESLGAGQVKAIEVSVLWHTEGKGDVDMAVHQFWRRDSTDQRPIDPQQPERFETVLPNSPLSYDGQIVKIRWSIRVRIFPYAGKEIVADKRFRLGNQPVSRNESVAGPAGGPAAKN